MKLWPSLKNVSFSSTNKIEEGLQARKEEAKESTLTLLMLLNLYLLLLRKRILLEWPKEILLQSASHSKN